MATTALATSAPPPTKIFVGRLPDYASVEGLRHIFERYGTVTECDILNRYGFVHMKTEEMAQEAIANLNNSEFMGSRITVEQSTGLKSAKKMRGGFFGGMRGRGRGGMMRPYAREMGMRRPFSMDSRPPPHMAGGPSLRNGFYDEYSRDHYDDYYDRRPPPSMGYRDPERRPYLDSFDRYTMMERDRRPLPPPYPSIYERRSEYPSRLSSDMYRRRTPPQLSRFDDRFESPRDMYGPSRSLERRMPDSPPRNTLGWAF